MARKEEATLLVRVLTSGQKALQDVGKSFSDLGKRVQSFGRSLVENFSERFVVTAGDVVNALQRVGEKIVEFAGRAVEIQTVRNAFTNLATSQGHDADQMLAKMRELSAGTVSDLNLMKQANQAMLLGLPVERFGEMLEIARAAAKATGQSMDFMLQSIVTGLGRQSKLMLDNLGIVIKAEDAYEKYAKQLGVTAGDLTEAEKKQAFVNHALDIGTANAKAAGSSSSDLGSQWERLKSQAANLATRIAEKLIPAMNDLVFAGNYWIDVFSKMFPDDANQSVEQLTEKIDKLKIKMQELAAQGGGGPSGTRIDSVRAEIEELEALKMAAAEREVDLEEKKNQGLLAKQAELAEAKRLKSEQDAILAQENAILKQEQDIAMIGANEMQKAELEVKFLDDKIKREEDHQKKLALMKDKQVALDKVRSMRASAEQLKIEQTFAQGRVNILQATAGLVTAIAGNESKAAFYLSKAAALAQAWVSMNLGAANALATVPYPANFGAAAQVKTAGYINMAAIGATTIQGLATGGIVKAQPGGAPFIIGEGGRNEAVVPLPDDFDPDSPNLGGGNTYIFQGPVMGDQTQAREFAIQLDRELMKLRQRNESVAFDEGLF